MKKVISFIVGTALFALLLIIGIDKYTDNRIIKENSEASASEDITKEETTEQVLKEPETTNKEVESGQESSYAQELSEIKYVDASATIENKFNANLVAKSAILVNLNTKSIVYSKEASTRVSPASTTKILTALTALRFLDKNETITIGNEIYKIGAGSSTAYLAVGDRLTVQEVIQGLLISSGNDAAYVLAVNTSRKVFGDNISDDLAIEFFIELMNNNVKLLGLENTHFTTPDGYDSDNQYSTANDLAVIAYEAYENDVIKEAVALESKYVKSKGITWTTTNQLLVEESDYYYKYAMGMKTGSTGNAGKCLISIADDGDNRYISVVLDSDETGRWEDSLQLLKYGLEVVK